MSTDALRSVHRTENFCKRVLGVFRLVGAHAHGVHFEEVVGAERLGTTAEASPFALCVAELRGDSFLFLLFISARSDLRRITSRSRSDADLSKRLVKCCTPWSDCVRGLNTVGAIELPDLPLGSVRATPFVAAAPSCELAGASWCTASWGWLSLSSGMLSIGDLRHEAGCNAGAGEAELAGVWSDRLHLHNFSQHGTMTLTRLCGPDMIVER